MKLDHHHCSSCHAPAAVRELVRQHQAFVMDSSATRDKLTDSLDAIESVLLADSHLMLPGHCAELPPGVAVSMRRILQTLHSQAAPVPGGSR